MIKSIRPRNGGRDSWLLSSCVLVVRLPTRFECVMKARPNFFNLFIYLVVAGAAVCPVVLLLCRWPSRQLSQAAQWWQLLMCALLGLLGTGNGA